jgi:ribosomal protein S18 acetylase RimI-like enzyme
MTGTRDIARTPRIRKYCDEDLSAVYKICVRTADSGGDARGLYSSDDLMGDLFVGPYLYLEPAMAFVLDDGFGAVGYIVGTSTTARFVSAYREQWIPRLADRYPKPPNPAITAEGQMLALHYWPERMLLAELSDYPAHLHINLLPDYQGLGYGRELVETFLSAAGAAGAPAAHVVPLTANRRALAFYRHLGFIEIPIVDPGPVTYLGRTIRA